MKSSSKAMLLGAGALALLISSGAASANSHMGHMGHMGWMSKGWSQWHPHQSSTGLSTMGTQGYFTTASVGDSDGDGVNDNLDQCPNTPAGAAVDVQGCALDSDGDGVADYKDQCPDTPQNAPVNAQGCPLDSDGDGVPDFRDECPNTPRGTEVTIIGCPADSDGDGVTNSRDACPDTPHGIMVNERGCSRDTDGDGVLDRNDRCPKTPAGASVNNVGCWVVTGVHFDTGRASIQSRSYTVLNKVAMILKENPGLRYEVQGHTDSRGGAAMNQRLSQRRAEAVRHYLTSRGVDAGRLTARGYGPDKPVGTNDTAEGRRMNRRVELHPMM